MHRVFVFVVIAIFLVACGSSTSQQATREVLTPIIPTVTQGGEIWPDIQPLLVQDGDLPVAITAGEINNRVPALLGDKPSPDKIISQRFTQDSQDVGGVTILYYNESKVRSEVYQLYIGTYIRPQRASDIGDFAHVANDPRLKMIVFGRCKVVASIVFNTKIDEEDVLSYAKSLDTRIKDISCQ